jgi:hypothetical protein
MPKVGRSFRLAVGQAPAGLASPMKRLNWLSDKLPEIAAKGSDRHTDVFDYPLTVALLGSGFLPHLHTSVFTICQNPSLIKSP